MKKKYLSVLLIFLLVISCKKNISKEQKVSKIKDNTSFIKIDSLIKMNNKKQLKIDSLKREVNKLLFFKDSCICYGKLGIAFIKLGHPVIENEKIITKQEFLRNKIFRIEIYSYKRKKLLFKKIVTKEQQFKYFFKLKKQTNYRVKLFSKLKSKNKFIQTKGMIRKTISTKTEDSLQINLNTFFGTTQ